jgi:hypothetical protein
MGPSSQSRFFLQPLEPEGGPRQALEERGRERKPAYVELQAMKIERKQGRVGRVLEKTDYCGEEDWAQWKQQQQQPQDAAASVGSAYQQPLLTRRVEVDDVEQPARIAGAAESQRGEA